MKAPPVGKSSNNWLLIHNGPLHTACQRQITLRPAHWPRGPRLTNNSDSKVHGANMGPIWADRTQMGPMLAPWTLLDGHRAFHSVTVTKLEVSRDFVRSRLSFRMIIMIQHHWKHEKVNKKAPAGFRWLNKISLSNNNIRTWISH